MRKINQKRVWALCAIVLFAQILPMNGIFAAASENTIISQDFEGYGDNTPGAALVGNGWEITVQSGDGITITTDTVTGSKAMRMEIGNTTSNKTSANAVFEDVQAGVVKVSFDFRAENHSKYLTGVGSIMYDTFSQYGALSMFAFQNDVYATGYWHTVGSLSNYKSKYAHFDMIANVSAGTCDIYMNGALVKKGAELSNSVIDYVSFNVMNGVNDLASYNGTDTGNGIYWVDNLIVQKVGLEVLGSTPSNGTVDVSTESSLSLTFNTPVNADITDKIQVYKNSQLLSSADYSVSFREGSSSIVDIYINNGLAYGTQYEIKALKTITPVDTTYALMSTDYTCSFTTASFKPLKDIFIDDFNNYTEGAGAAELSNKGWEITLQSGDAISVTNDPVTGSKAMKMEIGNMTNIKTEANAVFGDMQNVTLKVSYDFRAENHSKYLTGIGSMMYDTFNKYGVLSMFTFQNDIYATGSWLTIGSLANCKESYTHMDVIANLAAQKCDIYKNEILVQKDVPLSEANTNYVSFNVKNGINDNESYNGSDTGNGIYWIDNLKVQEYHYPQVTQTLPANSASDVSADSDVSVTFSELIIPESVSNENVTVYADGVQLSQTLYECSAQNNTLNINFINNLNYNTNYKVVIGTGILAGNSVGLEKAYEFSFTTEPVITNFSVKNSVGEAVSSLANVAGQNVTVSVSIANSFLNNYVIIGAMKSDTKQLKRIKLCSKPENTNATEFDLSVPSEANDNWNIECYLWDSVGSMKPICVSKALEKE